MLFRDSSSIATPITDKWPGYVREIIRTAALKAEAQGITGSLIDCDALMLDAIARCQPG